MYLDDVWATSYVEPPNQMTFMAVVLVKDVEFGVLASYMFKRL